MPLARTIFNTFAVTGASTYAAWTITTRNSKFVPFPVDDPILSSPAFQAQNPNRNPASQDICVRRVPLKDIKPSLLEGEGKLVEGFCAGIWGGVGYQVQRRVLERKYRNSTTTAHQLWTRTELQAASYEPGTQITDHFEVVSKTPDAIVVRCGDSPLKTGVRPSDGLFEMGVDVKREEGVAEFWLKSVFFQGEGKAQEKPMPWYMEAAHRVYTKLWMESAVMEISGR